MRPSVKGKQRRMPTPRPVGKEENPIGCCAIGTAGRLTCHWNTYLCIYMVKILGERRQRPNHEPWNGWHSWQEFTRLPPKCAELGPYSIDPVLFNGDWNISGKIWGWQQEKKNLNSKATFLTSKCLYLYINLSCFLDITPYFLLT